MLGDGLGIRAVDMNVPVEMVARLEGFNEPAKGFDPLVWQILFIVDAPRRCMADENVQITPAEQFIPEQSGDYAQDMQPHLALGILERSIAVAQAALHARQDQALVINHPAVQVSAPVRVRLWTHHGVLDLAGMVAAHVEKRDIQHADHELQIVVGQVAAAQDQIHVSKAFFHLGAVDRFNLLIAQ